MEQELIETFEDPTFREKIGEALQLARIANMMDEYDPQAEMEASHKQVGGWFDAFVGGPQYQPLTEIQRAKAPGIVRFFTECSFRHIGAAPEKWNQSVLKYLSSLPSQTRPQRPLPVRQR